MRRIIQMTGVVVVVCYVRSQQLALNISGTDQHRQVYVPSH